MNDNISFITPYLSGERMLKVHIDSVRKFHPNAEILVSGRGEGHFDGAKYFNDDAFYFDAVKKLIERTTNDIIVICDHDTVLLSPVTKYADMLLNDEIDLVSIEERIHHPWADTWMRYAPGFTDMTFFMCDKRKLPNPWPEFNHHTCHINYPEHVNHEGHYGLCQVLKRHHYLRPYHTKNYGMGNLMKDGEDVVLWHQWYGSYRVRPITEKGDRVFHFGGKEYLEGAETRFLNDYPNLDLSELRPAFDDR